MRFLVDANLSPRAAASLSSAGFESIHVGDVGLLTAADQAILDYAAANGLVIVSADLQGARVRLQPTGQGAPGPRAEPQDRARTGFGIPHQHTLSPAVKADFHAVGATVCTVAGLAPAAAELRRRNARGRSLALTTAALGPARIIGHRSSVPKCRHRRIACKCGQ